MPREHVPEDQHVPLPIPSMIFAHSPISLRPGCAKHSKTRASVKMEVHASLLMANMSSVLPDKKKGVKHLSDQEDKILPQPMMPQPMMPQLMMPDMAFYAVPILSQQLGHQASTFFQDKDFDSQDVDADKSFDASSSTEASSSLHPLSKPPSTASSVCGDPVSFAVDPEEFMAAHGISIKNTFITLETPKAESLQRSSSAPSFW